MILTEGMNNVTIAREVCKSLGWILLSADKRLGTMTFMRNGKMDHMEIREAKDRVIDAMRV